MESMFLTKADKKLLSHKLTINDPSSVPNLMETAPADWKTSKIYGKYDLNAGKNTVWQFCALKGRHRHGKGYVMESPAKLRFQIGVDCGRIEFGLDFGDIELEFRGRENRQLLLSRVISSTPAAELLLTQLTSDVFRRQEGEVTELSKTLKTGFFKAISQFDNNALNYTIREIDGTAMNKRKEELEDRLEDLAAQKKRKQITLTRFKEERSYLMESKKDWEPIYRFVTKNHATLSGTELIAGESKLTPIIQRAVRHLKAGIRIIKSAENSEQLPIKKLSKILTHYRNAVSSVGDSKQYFTSPSRFFDRLNLQNLCTWSTLNRYSPTISIDGQKLVCAGKQGEFTLSIPSNFEEPDWDYFTGFDESLDVSFQKPRSGGDSNE